MTVIACYNIKGGVGKTATVVNLAYIAAKMPIKTLIWDLDPQGASSFYFRIKPKIKGGSKAVIAGERDLDDLIKATDFENLDLIPADFSFRNLDLVLDEAKKPTARLKKLLKPLQQEYPLIFLDCPPNISLLSEAVFSASDVLLSPIIPTTLSLRTLDLLKKHLKDNKLKQLQLLPFFSMADRRKTMHRDIMASLQEKHPDICQSIIPYASEVERMGLEHNPVGEFMPRSRSYAAYEALWDEVQEAIGLNTKR